MKFFGIILMALFFSSIVFIAIPVNVTADYVIIQKCDLASSESGGVFPAVRACDKDYVSTWIAQDGPGSWIIFNLTGFWSIHNVTVWYGGYPADYNVERWDGSAWIFVAAFADAGLIGGNQINHNFAFNTTLTKAIRFIGTNEPNGPNFFGLREVVFGGKTTFTAVCMATGITTNTWLFGILVFTFFILGVGLGRSPLSVLLLIFSGFIGFFLAWEVWMDTCSFPLGTFFFALSFFPILIGLAREID